MQRSWGVSDDVIPELCRVLTKRVASPPKLDRKWLSQLMLTPAAQGARPTRARGQQPPQAEGPQGLPDHLATEEAPSF